LGFCPLNAGGCKKKAKSGFSGKQPVSVLSSVQYEGKQQKNSSVSGKQFRDRRAVQY
jgi:hypothetical protein